MQHKEGTAFVKMDGLLVRVVSQPTVRVKHFGDGSDAAIYATNSIHASQVKSNPFTGNADGSYDYYVPDTRINVEISGGTPPLAATVVSSDQIAYDPFVHFSHSNLNSGYVYQQNSAGLAAPVSVFSLGLVAAGADYVRLNAVSSGGATLQYNPGSGFPVLDVVNIGSGWIQAWRTSSGHGGTQTNAAMLDVAGFSVGGRPNLASLSPARAITINASGTNAYASFELVREFNFIGALRLRGPSNDNDIYLYNNTNNALILGTSGGGLLGTLHAASGFTLSGKTFIGNACGLTTSSAIITASKAIAAGDFGVTQVCSTATNITLTLSNGTGTVGQVLPIFRAGAGTVTVTSGGSVTILGKQFTVNSLSGASLECIASNVWLFRA